MKYCRLCKKEFANEEVFCSDCLIELHTTDTKINNYSTIEYSEMITVYETNDMVELSFIKGLLKDADIHYNSRNEYTQSLFALGLMGGTNPLIGPIKIDVEKTKEAEAIALITSYLNKQKNS